MWLKIAYFVLMIVVTYFSHSAGRQSGVVETEQTWRQRWNERIGHRSSAVCKCGCHCKACNCNREGWGSVAPDQDH